MTTTIARDATGIPLEPGDRVGSFDRRHPGTLVRRDGGKVFVRHDDATDETMYLVAELSGCVPGLILLNLEAPLA